MVHVAGVAGWGPGGEAAFELLGRAAAEDLDWVGVEGQQSGGGLGAEVGVEYHGGERSGDRVQHLVAGDAEAAGPGAVAGAEGVEQGLLDEVLADQGQAESGGQGAGQGGLACRRWAGDQDEGPAEVGRGRPT
jgi:hypothetical protein